MKKLLVLLVLTAMLCAGCSAGEETVVPDFVLTYAENQAMSYPTTLGGQYFARLVKERTGGKIVIQVKASGQFGTEQEVLQQLYIGGVDFARLSLSSVSDELPVLNVLQLPFLYEDSDHMWRILDGQLGEDFLRVFQQKNLVGLSWYDAGSRSFYSKTPIESPDDLQGMTVRVHGSQLMSDMVTLLGGTPVNIAYSDVYAAFETGQIDAAENNWPSYQSQSHYAQAPYYTLDQHTRVPEVQLASARTWNQLSDEYRQIIIECARESALYQRELWSKETTHSRSIALSRGCQEIILTEEALAAFRERVLPLYELYCGDHMELIERIRSGTD